MSYQRINNATDKLDELLVPFIPDSEARFEFVQALKELSEAIADDQSDRDNRRGEYDPDY